MNFRFASYMQNLDISDNVILSLDKTSLRDLEVISLVQLNASRNYISYINVETFFGQRQLHTVDLSSNSLMNIETKTFLGNPSLEILSLSSNQYLRLPGEGPFLYSQSLRVLKLSNCNLYHLPPETFQTIPNLQELYISHNMFEVLNSVQSIGSLTFLDVSYKSLTDLQSDIFTTLPELIRLNLSHNKLSTLKMTLMPQLVKVSSSIDLNGNPWDCDCLMFNTIYSWCRNNSVDLDLVCSSPPKFKDNSWSIYEADGCDDYNTDFTDQLEEVMMMIEHELSVKTHETYLNPVASNSLETQIQIQETEYDFTYKYISIALSVVLFFLSMAVAVLSYSLITRLSLCKGSAQSDS